MQTVLYMYLSGTSWWISVHSFTWAYITWSHFSPGHLGVHEKGLASQLQCKGWRSIGLLRQPIALGKSHNASTCVYGLSCRITSVGLILEATINSRGNNHPAALGATPLLAVPPVQAILFTGPLWASVAAWGRLHFILTCAVGILHGHMHYNRLCGFCILLSF